MHYASFVSRRSASASLSYYPSDLAATRVDQNLLLYISGAVALKFEPPNTFCQINFEMDPPDDAFEVVWRECGYGQEWAATSLSRCRDARRRLLLRAPLIPRSMAMAIPLSAQVLAKGLFMWTMRHI